MQSSTAHSTRPLGTPGRGGGGGGGRQRDPCNLIISFSFKSFRLKLNFPRQLTKEEFLEFMNE